MKIIIEVELLFELLCFLMPIDIERLIGVRLASQLENDYYNCFRVIKKNVRMKDFIYK
jgi:hypothetical protein